MFVYNNFRNDARIEKEARTLLAAGCSVTVVGVLDKTTKPYEEKSGIQIIRVTLIPLHYRIRRALRSSWLSFKETVRESSFGDVIKPIWHTLHPQPADDIKLDTENFQENDKSITAAKPSQEIQAEKADNKIEVKRTINRQFLLFYKHLLLLDFYDKAFKAIANEPADIYHAHDLLALPAAYKAAQRHRKKFVYDSHELYLERNTLEPINQVEKFLWRFIEGFLIGKASAVITVSESIANELAQRYRAKTPTLIMNTPSQKRDFFKGEDKNLRTLLGVSDEYYLLLYSGSRTFNRGLEKAIESLIYLPKCHLVLMGYGTEQYNKKLQTLAEEVGVRSRVSFFGPVPPEEVTAYAASADLGIAPIENVCLSYYYCSPNKLFEYIIAGIPVVASNFPEMKKIIEKFEIGCTFDPSEPKNIAEAVLHMLEEPEKLQRMKQNTAAVSKVYNWENESKKLLELYRLLK
jgi:glycosyltransferase involved in cell wall biosynthesis